MKPHIEQSAAKWIACGLPDELKECLHTAEVFYRPHKAPSDRETQVLHKVFCYPGMGEKLRALEPNYYAALKQPNHDHYGPTRHPEIVFYDDPGSFVTWLLEVLRGLPHPEDQLPEPGATSIERTEELKKALNSVQRHLRRDDVHIIEAIENTHYSNTFENRDAEAEKEFWNALIPLYEVLWKQEQPISLSSVLDVWGQHATRVPQDEVNRRPTKGNYNAREAVGHLYRQIAVGLGTPINPLIADIVSAVYESVTTDYVRGVISKGT